MKRRYLSWTLSAVFALGAASAFAQTAPFIKHTFDEGESGWTAFGGDAKASLTKDAANVKQGTAALQFDYAIKKGVISALVLPTPEGALTKMKSLRLWVKSDHATPLIVSLQEKDGGRYLAMVHVPKDSWQRVELAPSDFNLSSGENDPKDPNNRLDTDKVESISVADLGQFFAQAEAGLADLFNVKMGPHTLYLDDFSVGDEPLPSAFPAVGEEVRLESFTRPQLAWLGVGDLRLSVASGKPIEGKSLQADYKQQTTKVIGLVKPVPLGTLAGKDKLVFSVSSAKALRLIVQVEELGGGKYNTIVDVPGNSEVKEFSIGLSTLIAAEDSKDKNDHLDKELINQVLFIDMSGLIGEVNQDNTLWIGKLRATK